MALISTGVDFGVAQKECDELMNPVDPGVYELQVQTEPVLGKTDKGRDRLMFILTVVNGSNQKANGKHIRYFANLPQGNDLSGVGYLTQMCVALKRPWVGQEIDTAHFIGASCRANVGVGKDGKWNDIISFV